MTLKPHFLRYSNTGSSYVSGELAEWLGDKNIGARQGGTVSSANTGQDRAVASDPEEPTTSYWKITSSRQTWKRKSRHSLIITIISDTTRASTASLLLTPTSGEAKRFSKQRERIKLKTIETRRLQYSKNAA